MVKKWTKRIYSNTWPYCFIRTTFWNRSKHKINKILFNCILSQGFPVAYEMDNNFLWNKVFYLKKSELLSIFRLPSHYPKIRLNHPESEYSRNHKPIIHVNKDGSKNLVVCFIARRLKIVIDALKAKNYRDND